ncbi:ATP-binding protein [Kribbella sp. NPDC051770]|uniref:sensor histidine kinase n=1 Tax=Kribbella sp. NPDC051770 TaxID=3155413 RepID=UPI00341ABB8B
MAARRSILVRLLAGAVLVSLCSIAATAWLAARSTTVAIQQEQGRALADDSKIYDALLGYAATHAAWPGVGTLIEQLSRETGRQITLTTNDRKLIAGPAKDLASASSVTIDPFAVDPDLGGADRIDPRVVGPFKLNAADQKFLGDVAKRVLNCVRGRTGVGIIQTAPTGRPRIVGASEATISSCDTQGVLDQLTRSERKPYSDLQALINTCLAGQKIQFTVKLQPDLTWSVFDPDVSGPVPPDGVPGERIEACVTQSRRTQLDPYVAPLARLFVNTPSRAEAGFDLSPANQKRIAGVAAAVLLITVIITVAGGFRLVQPLRALTRASRRMTGGDESVRVRVRGRDEIGQLSAAFNELADSRARTEALRRAMVSDIAHELRTPLSNIRGWLEAVEDGVTKPDQAFIQSLSEEAALLQHIIDDLRDLATADAGNLRIHPERVHLPTLLEQVVAAHHSEAGAAEVTLTSAPSPSAPAGADGELELEADPVRLRQVVGNLVVNALRFTPAGGSVRVTGRREGSDVVIDVIDTGTGISPDDLPKVFDRFWRAEQSRNRHTGGSGLGLAIVRSLVEAHHGQVTARSTLGQGSTFTVRLPLGTSD